MSTNENSRSRFETTCNGEGPVEALRVFYSLDGKVFPACIREVVCCEEHQWIPFSAWMVLTRLMESIKRWKKIGILVSPSRMNYVAGERVAAPSKQDLYKYLRRERGTVEGFVMGLLQLDIDKRGLPTTVSD